MTAVVQPDLGPPPAHKYKDETADDPPAEPPTAFPPGGGLLHQRPESPHQRSTAPLPPGPYSAAPGLNGVPLQHPPAPSYPAPPQNPGYYASASNPYPATTTPGQYPPSGCPMARHNLGENLDAANLLRSTPRSDGRNIPDAEAVSSNLPPYATVELPASVASPQTHDQHGRNTYAQSPQVPSQMYGYHQPYSPINPVHPAYNPQPPAPQHPLTTQSLMMPPQTAPIQHPSSSTHQPPIANAPISSPRAKVESIPPQVQRPPMPPPALTSPSTTIPSLSANNVHVSQSTNSNPTSAAPGPIPATTPQIVHQDSNGVQWISFEYSRDRVKMEYTIRCDVESVNVEALPQDFKTQNCVYPRACCSKEQYRGNRLIYETECNAVGWALTQLNPLLRGKRGLIQRAVDSWRNSNQDPRLRSRRVRRMAKMTRRQSNNPPSHQLGTSGAPVPHLLTQSPTTLAPGARSNAPLPLAAPLQHHSQHPEGQAGNEEVSGSTEYSNGARRPLYAPPSAKPAISDTHENAPDFRPGSVFHGGLPYPVAPGGLGEPSMPPPLQERGFDSLGRHSVATTSDNRHGAEDSHETESATPNPSDKVLFGGLPVSKRRKFILIDDHQRGGRARVKVTLDRVNMDEIPDSYRLSNAVFPRAYYPVQMKRSPGRTVPHNRYFESVNEDDDDEEDADVGGDDDYDDGKDPITISRTLVPFTTSRIPATVPQLSRRRHRRDKVMNEIGYRMSWSQSRVFAGRHLFLQRSLDAYRNKMRGSMVTIGQEPLSIASHFETRIGKRKFNARNRSTKIDQNKSAFLREVEEVEA